MKTLKRILPVFVFVALFGCTMTVFAARVATTTMNLGRGETKRTSYYTFEEGWPNLMYNVTSINGDSNKNNANSTKLRVIMRNDAEETAFNTLQSIDQTSLGAFKVASTSKHYGEDSWYAEFSNKIEGINYASFYSNELLLGTAIRELPQT